MSNSQSNPTPSILVVEDELLVAMVVENILEDLGAGLVGPATSVGQALELVEAGGFGGALLDVSLGGERIDAVADALAARRIPFIFTTGHGADALPDAHRDRPILTKPFSDEGLVAALRRYVLDRDLSSIP
ncbi:response regulator [Skermanella rosea]|uniref:response regulator n=1 Tax=Skermanella rosea TaxID=1817965 RepID=UPI0019319AB2|nr:response regulator [Skermanella rosea]UEM05943.1 response regulator [Skermanella rosea]